MKTVTQKQYWINVHANVTRNTEILSRDGETIRLHFNGNDLIGYVVYPKPEFHLCVVKHEQKQTN